MSAKPQQESQGNRGHFKRGHDPRRHKFTTEECSAGFWAAVESIVSRHPEAVMPDGRHIVVNFLKSKQRTVIN